jgi:hypothetical protein
MAAAAAAAEAAPQVEAGGEDNRRSFPVKILALDERPLFGQEFYSFPVDCTATSDVTQRTQRGQREEFK